ncbi:MAG: nucleotidyltransferase domain-containing protein [Pseudomonadota bacterium]
MLSVEYFEERRREIADWQARGYVEMQHMLEGTGFDLDDLVALGVLATNYQLLSVDLRTHLPIGPWAAIFKTGRNQTCFLPLERRDELVRALTEARLDGGASFRAALAAAAPAADDPAPPPADGIDPARRQEILAELDRIEQEHGVRILHAIESGSRAWGFPSADSDYDVRIIYAHQRDWYLSVFEGRDVIEQPISGDLDIGGWDVRKTLRLLAGGNAVVHEWLASPIVYRQDEDAVAELRALAAAAFNPRATFHHYLAMAGKKLDVAEGEACTAKRFLYGMRTLLCARWVADTGTAPPMRFQEFLARYLPADAAPGAAIVRLVAAKASGSEQDVEGDLGGLLATAHELLADLRSREAPPASAADEGVLDQGFRRLVGA